ncbi:MAG: methyl-accepting chemotaxis protein [Spirochaetota bacterium]
MKIRTTTEAFLKNMENLSAEITNISSELDEIRYQSKRMVEKNSSIQDASELIRQKVQNGSEVMSSSVFLISELVEQNRELNNTIKELWENYGSITSVAEELINVSKNTGLIALNAEIESAHAGENGKGFTVVAEEMGKLARKNSKVSRLIAESANGMKQQAKLTELNVTASVEFAEGAQIEIEKADRNYKDVSNSIEVVMNDSREFTYSLKNLEISILMIVDLLSQTNELMQKFIQDSQSILNSLHSQASSIDSINDVVTSTFGVSRILNSLISQFKISNFKEVSEKQKFYEDLIEKILNSRGIVVMAVFSDDIQFAKNLQQQLSDVYIEINDFLESQQTFIQNSPNIKDTIDTFLNNWEDFYKVSQNSIQLLISNQEKKARDLYNRSGREKIKKIVDLLLSSLSTN